PRRHGVIDLAGRFVTQLIARLVAHAAPLHLGDRRIVAHSFPADQRATFPRQALDPAAGRFACTANAPHRRVSLIPMARAESRAIGVWGRAAQRLFRGTNTATRSGLNSDMQRSYAYNNGRFL